VAINLMSLSPYSKQVKHQFADVAIP